MKHLFCLLILSLTTSSPALASSFDWTQGFNTDYSVSIDLWNPGTYAIDNSASGHHPYWETGGDFTGDGLSILVNGREDSSNSLVWGMSLDLEGSPFIIYAKNLCCTDKLGRQGPELGFWIDGIKVSNILTDGAGVWDVFSFLSPNIYGIHQYEIRNASSVYDGNDFALDFDRPVPEPATVLLLSTSLLGLIVGLKKKTNASR